MSKRGRVIEVAKRREKRPPIRRGVYREAIEAIFCFLMCRSRIPNFSKDVARIIAKMVYETRYSRIWLEGKKADAGRDSIERLKKQIISNPQDEDEMERNESIQERIEALSEFYKFI